MLGAPVVGSCEHSPLEPQEAPVGKVRMEVRLLCGGGPLPVGQWGADLVTAAQ